MAVTAVRVTQNTYTSVVIAIHPFFVDRNDDCVPP